MQRFPPDGGIENIHFLLGSALAVRIWQMRRPRRQLSFHLSESQCHRVKIDQSRAREEQVTTQHNASRIPSNCRNYRQFAVIAGVCVIRAPRRYSDPVSFAIAYTQNVRSVPIVLCLFWNFSRCSSGCTAGYYTYCVVIREESEFHVHWDCGKTTWSASCQSAGRELGKFILCIRR